MSDLENLLYRIQNSYRSIFTEEEIEVLSKAIRLAIAVRDMVRGET